MNGKEKRPTNNLEQLATEQQMSKPKTTTFQGIETPIIKPGDDLQKIVIQSIIDVNNGNFDDGDIICVTEAVVAIAQNNFATYEDIAKDIEWKFPGVKTLALVDPIQSRNRFLGILKAIAKTPSLEKIYIIMTYPTDEVGNRFISDMEVMRSGINPYTDILSPDDFYAKFGKPKHVFTGRNYIEEYLNACEGKGEVILCNNFEKIASEIDCENYLVCSIHRKEETTEALYEGGAGFVLDLSHIMNVPNEFTGYNSEYGLYGTNFSDGDKLKLLPKDCKEFVDGIQEEIYERFGKNVEVMIFGDGAFKDPVGGIWELADPKPCIESTDNLKGAKPLEVKAKLFASANGSKSSDEIKKMMAEEEAKLKSDENITSDISLGTTPRFYVDTIATGADIVAGSGSKCTPVVYVKNFIRK